MIIIIIIIVNEYD